MVGYLNGKAAGTGPDYPLRSRPPRELLQRRATQAAASRTSTASRLHESSRVQPAVVQRWQRCNSAPISTGAHRPRQRTIDPGVAFSLGEAPPVPVTVCAARVDADRFRISSSDWHAPAQMGPGLPVHRNAMHSEMSFRRCREPEKAHTTKLHQGLMSGATTYSEIYAPEHHGPNIPASMFSNHSEVMARRAKPPGRSHMRDIPTDYLPFERPCQTDKYRFFANKSIEMSPHFYSAKPHEGLGEAKKRAGRGEILDVVPPVSHL